jgi:asparagine synthase (glutamine-hydrolysing)
MCNIIKVNPLQIEQITMCRIAGFFDTNGHRDYDLSSVLSAMRDSLAHGGPDDAGSFIDNARGLGLGHRRLSIIDLSEQGHQPMTFDNLTLVYNGEVYNYADIGEELEKYGYTFNSTSDTEVVVKAFHKWGIDCLEQFRGMWGFALWDATTNRLTLCRDRFGVKPLYWSLHNGLFLFGSELKALLKHPRFEKRLCSKGLTLYLQYGYIPAPYTIYENVYKLDPAHYLTFDGKNVVKQQYWDHRAQFANDSDAGELAAMPEDAVLSELERLLVESFKLRMIADVPVGLFLSGGVDSSLLTALLQKEYTRPLKTFTIGFREPAFDEANYAREVAKILGTEHSELYCTSQEAFKVIHRYPDLYDEPFADPSGIPTFLVSRLASEQVKVSVSADGADEQFGGYASYVMANTRFAQIDRPPFGSMLRALAKLMSGCTVKAPRLGTFPFASRLLRYGDKFAKLQRVLEQNSVLCRHEAMEKHFALKEVKALVSGTIEAIDRFSLYPHGYFEGLDPFAQMLLDDQRIYLPDDMLAKVDRASMAVALESREPFLDSRLVEFTSRLPMRYKFRNNVRKYALRRILGKYIPERLFQRRKLGFEIPLYDWFKTDLVKLFDAYLGETRILKEKIFKPQAIAGLRAAASLGSKAATHKLWMLLVFEMWHERWMR